MHEDKSIIDRHSDISVLFPWELFDFCSGTIIMLTVQSAASVRFH